MKKTDDVEPKDKHSYAYFKWLERENKRQLRKAGHKSNPIGNEPKKRKRFAKVDDSKIRTIDSDITYWDYLEKNSFNGQVIEPLESNPDLFEDDINNTVDE